MKARHIPITHYTLSEYLLALGTQLEALPRPSQVLAKYLPALSRHLEILV